MARKSLAEKAESRTRILGAAAKLIRTNGIEGTTVAEVMEEAGMTHGGFYRHFDSKEDLVAEAISVAVQDALNFFSSGDSATHEEATAYVSNYATKEHARAMASGCPIPLLSAEVARGSDAWRDALRAGVTKTTKKLTDGLNLKDEADALVLLSTLVGGLLIARGVGEGALQDKLLSGITERVQA
jgi:TetR/AcrR family transcriptional repressor of nem operon